MISHEEHQRRQEERSSERERLRKEREETQQALQALQVESQLHSPHENRHQKSTEKSKKYDSIADLPPPPPMNSSYQPSSQFLKFPSHPQMKKPEKPVKPNFSEVISHDDLKDEDALLEYLSRDKRAQTPIYKRDSKEVPRKTFGQDYSLPPPPADMLKNEYKPKLPSRNYNAPPKKSLVDIEKSIPSPEKENKLDPSFLKFSDRKKLFQNQISKVESPQGRIKTGRFQLELENKMNL